MKTKTMDLAGKEYAQVKDRINEFRKGNANGLIETVPTVQADGTIMFKARVLKDKSDANSAEATGHSLGKVGAKQKDFEKLETIAVGRALALLGYASDGEIASSEEMEEFTEYKKTQFEELIMACVEKISDCTTLDELKTVWADMPIEAKKELEKAKEDKKSQITQIKDENIKV